MDLAELSVDEREPRGERLDMGARRLGRSGGDEDRRCVQALEHAGGVDAPDAVALEQPGDGGLAHPSGLVRARHERPQVEEPVGASVVGDVEDLRIVAPQLLAHAVGEPGAFRGEVLGDARELAQFDNHRIDRRQAAEAARIGPERVTEHLGIAAVVLGPGWREAVAEAVELLRVDGMDGKAALDQAFHHRPMGHLDCHMDRAGRPARHLEYPIGQLGEPCTAVSKAALPDFAASGIQQTDVMRLGRPVDAYEPVAFFVHLLHPPCGRAAAMPADPCTGARWRRLPTGHPSRPPTGARVPPRCSRHRGRLVAPGRTARSRQHSRARLGSR